MDAAARMKKWDVGILLVSRDGQVVGILTDRDITIRAVARGCDPKVTKVFEIMSGEVLFGLEDQEVEQIAEIMENRCIRRLPVLNPAQQLVGIITLGDLAARLDKSEVASRILRRVSLRPGSPHSNGHS